MTRINQFGQPVGELVPGWSARPRPPMVTLVGRFCRLERLNPAHHAASLWQANSLDQGGQNFTYLFTEPFASEADYTAWLRDAGLSED